MSVATLLAWPAVANAQGSAGGTSAPAPPPASPAAPAQGVSGDMGLNMPAHLMRGKRVRISGQSRKAKRKVVRIERRAPGGTWLAVGSVRASKTGAWTLVWK